MAEQLALDLPVPDAEPVRRETPSESLRRRQTEAIAAGYHPLGVALRQAFRLHPDVPRARSDRPGETSLGLLLSSTHPRCGGCVHRVIVGGHARDYAKCQLTGRHTHGPGTDVRAWWPACDRWEAKAP